MRLEQFPAGMVCGTQMLHGYAYSRILPLQDHLNLFGSCEGAESMHTHTCAGPRCQIIGGMLHMMLSPCLAQVWLCYAATGLGGTSHV